MATFEEENKDERQPLNSKHITHYVDVSKNLDTDINEELLTDPLVAQLPKAMLKYIKTPEQHQSYVNIGIISSLTLNVHLNLTFNI